MATSGTPFSYSTRIFSAAAHRRPPENGGAAVYVAAVPLRAAAGPAQAVVSAAYSLGLWNLQHFMVLIKPTPSTDHAHVFDFQPQNPEDFYVALAALSGREVPGIVLKRKLKKMPRTRCWFVGYSDSCSLDVVNQFNQTWPTSLIIGKRDCRHYTNGLVECLIGERCVLDILKRTSL